MRPNPPCFSQLKIFLIILGISNLFGLWAVPASAQAVTASAYSSSAGISTRSTTIPLTDTEVSVLQQVVAKLQCFGPTPINTSGTTYSFLCMAAAGHSNDVSITRYATPSEAYATFVSLNGEPRERFGCYNANSWVYYEDPVNQTFRHRYHIWVVENWLVRVHAFDDTYYDISYAPLIVSRYVVRAAQRTLFSACYSVYLPFTYAP